MLNVCQIAHLDTSLHGGVPDPYRVYPDGTAVWVYPMAFGNGRLCIGHEENRYGFDRGFCYESVAQAFAAADVWDGTGEPEGWHRCLQTGRRRPGGDASQEYVNP